MEDRRSELFSEEDLPGLLESQKEKAKNQVIQALNRRRPGFNNELQMEHIINSYSLAVPKIEGYKASVDDSSKVKYSVRIDFGHGDFFRYKPQNEITNSKPAAIIYGDSLNFAMENEDDVTAIKQEWEEIYQNLQAWHKVVSDEISEGNAKLKQEVEELATQLKEKNRKAQAFEDELNN